MSEITYRLPQVRRVTGSVPGPSSSKMEARRQAAVSTAVTSSSPFYAFDADDGLLVDADGNSVIDLGAGIAVTTVGASAPAVTEAIRQLPGVSHIRASW